jgi:hypothetical protein
VLTESARMSSAAEARFRIQTPPPTSRAVSVIPLDAESEHFVAVLSERAWGGVTFLPASAVGDLVQDGHEADLVVMIATAGADAQAAAAIGEACSRRRVPTATCVVRGRATPEAALSRTLAQVRPWSLMVVVANDGGYVEDLLRYLR